MSINEVDYKKSPEFYIDALTKKLKQFQTKFEEYDIKCSMLKVAKSNESEISDIEKKIRSIKDKIKIWTDEIRLMNVIKNFQDKKNLRELDILLLNYSLECAIFDNPDQIGHKYYNELFGATVFAINEIDDPFAHRY